MGRAKPFDDLGNGVRPRAALGVQNPIWRLGALVSLPLSIGKVIMVQRPDRSLSLKQRLHATAGTTFPVDRQRLDTSVRLAHINIDPDEPEEANTAFDLGLLGSN